MPTPGTTRSGRPGQPWVTLEQVEEHAEGLVCLSGCAGEGALAGAWERGDTAAGARRSAGACSRPSGRERFRVELQRPYWRHDRARNRWLAGLAERLGVPCVATGNVHSHAAAAPTCRTRFVAVRLGMTLEESEPRRRGNRSSALASPRAMAARFAEHPEAVAETLRLAERLEFDLDHRARLPLPARGRPRRRPRAGRGSAAHRLAERYAGSRRRAEAERRLEQELATIRHLGLSGFFLLHHDLLELAREVAAEVRGPSSARAVLPPGPRPRLQRQLDRLLPDRPLPHRPGQGRALRRPLPQRGGRPSMPDIDLDFPRDIREVLIPRVHERYGAERSALVAAFPTYRPRGAVRDLGKVLGLPPEEIERVAKMVGFHERSGEIERDVVAAIGAERAARAALAGAARALPARRWACPATPPSTPAGW